MTAAERAQALAADKEIDCPRCGHFPVRRTGPFIDCPKCGLECTSAFAGIGGRPGDPTAAIFIHPKETPE